MIRPVLVFASDIAVNVADYAELWTTDDRFAVAIMDRSGLERAYGPSLFNQMKFRNLIAELVDAEPDSTG